MTLDATGRRFAGTSALVTGGGSGIGLGCAARLVEEGAAVTICGRSEDRLIGAVSSLGPTARHVVADVTDEDAVAHAVAVACEATGSLDVVVANDATRADYLAQMPIGRLGTVDDIAAAVAFLASREAGWVTGQCLGVDGGHSLRRGPDLAGLVGSLYDDQLAEQFDSRPNRVPDVPGVSA